jgi:seryl-tRNA synthetase
LWKNNSL